MGTHLSGIPPRVGLLGSTDTCHLTNGRLRVCISTTVLSGGDLDVVVTQLWSR